MTKLRYHLLSAGPMWQIAAQAGIPPWLLTKYSLGERPVPADTLSRLSVALDVPVLELTGVVEEDWLSDLG